MIRIYHDARSPERQIPLIYFYDMVLRCHIYMIRIFIVMNLVTFYQLRFS